MTALAPALRTALLHFVWQGIAVALLLRVALALLRTAQSRYLASCAALALLAVAPVATAFLVYHSPAPTIHTAAPTSSTAFTTPTAAVQPAPVASAWIVRLEPWALPLWSAGVLFFSLRLVWGCWRVSTMRRRGQPADAAILSAVAALARRMGLARTVRVLTAALPDGPSVVGWLRPVLLLPPATVLGLTPEQLEAVLAHELAHIRRYDHLVNAVQTLVETVLFYHPAVWWTSARIRHERELCCDDLAVRTCGDALCFARALTKLERLRILTPQNALGSTGGSMIYRVQRLIGAAPQECAPSKLSGLLALSLGVAGLALSAHWLHAQTAAPQKPQGITYISDTHSGDDAGVTVDLGGASIMHRTEVRYPESPLASGIQGTVTAQVTLDASGNVSDAHIISGPQELRKAVMHSVLDWHFAADAASTTRTVAVKFEKPAVAAASPQWQPGVLVAVDTATEGTVTNSADAAPPSPLNVTAYTADTAPQKFVLRKFQAGKPGQDDIVIYASDAQPPATTGRTLTNIEIESFSEALQNDLRSRLPVHIGDSLTAAQVDAIGPAIRKFDEHLNWHLTVHDHNAVTLSIQVPGDLDIVH